jgi:hypothetical protein
LGGVFGGELALAIFKILQEKRVGRHGLLDPEGRRFEMLRLKAAQFLE